MVWQQVYFYRQSTLYLPVQLHYVFGSLVQRHDFEISAPLIDDFLRFVQGLVIDSRQFRHELADRNLRHNDGIQNAVSRVGEAALLHSSSAVGAISECQVQYRPLVHQFTIGVEGYVYGFDAEKAAQQSTQINSGLAFALLLAPVHFLADVRVEYHSAYVSHKRD